MEFKHMFKFSSSSVPTASPAIVSTEPGISGKLISTYLKGF